MGGTSSSVLKFRSRSHSELDRIRPVSEQRSPKRRNRIARLAHSSSKHLNKISFKRKSSSKENVKSFRELVATWSTPELQSLHKEFDTFRTLLELCQLADSSRPHVANVGESLWNSRTKNVTLLYKTTRVDVHRCFIVVRSNVIKRLATPQSESVELPNSVFTEGELSCFIEYLYTEKWTGRAETLSEMRAWLGCSNSLEQDLRSLELSSATEGDLSITLTTRANDEDNSEQEQKVIPDEHTFRCHSEFIAARSGIFGDLIRFTSSNRIVLDEALLPRGFASLVFHFLYRDKLDLTKISDTASVQSSLSEARAIVSGRSPHSPLHRAIQIIHIARFFSLEKLVRLCEDVIVSNICTDSCVSVLCWALDGGSAYVARMAQRFLESEFAKILQSHHLFDVPQKILVSCLQSPFVQATEVELLEGIIRWGEHDLLKRMEDREPNIVADTSHSISRKGIRRSEMSGEELTTIVLPLAAFIRTDYVLPPFHQTLNNAYKRGFLVRAPLQYLICSSTSDINPDIHWFRPSQQATGPRFYIPYFRSLKSYISPEKPEIPNIANDETPLDVVVTNNEPELLEIETFEKVKSTILSEIMKLDGIYQIISFPRVYQKQLAVQYISTRVQLLAGLDPNSISVSLSYLDSPVIEDSRPPSSSDEVYSSRTPSLPDIMTLERRFNRMELSGDMETRL